MRTHHLKIHEKWVESLLDGGKRAEIRFNDRDYQSGDKIVFDQTVNDKGDVAGFGVFRDSEHYFEITHVLHSVPGLQSGYVILSIQPTSAL